MMLIAAFGKRWLSMELYLSYFFHHFRCVEYGEAHYVSLMIHPHENVILQRAASLKNLFAGSVLYYFK